MMRQGKSGRVDALQLFLKAAYLYTK